MGHAAITTHPHPSNDSAGYKISSSSTQQPFESSWQGRLVAKLTINPSRNLCYFGLPQRFLAYFPTSRASNLSKCDSLSKIFETLSLSCLSARKIADTTSNYSSHIVINLQPRYTRYIRSTTVCSTVQLLWPQVPCTQIQGMISDLSIS